MLSDIYCVDEQLYDTFVTTVKDSNILLDEGVDSLLNDYWEENDFLSHILDEKLLYCYYTEDTVGISVDVPFGTADHLEFEILYELLEKK